MEGRCITTGSYHQHICNRGQSYRFCRKKNYEFAEHSAGLAMGNNLYPACHVNMAADGAGSKYSIWAIQVFYTLCQEVGRKDGCGQKEFLTHWNSNIKCSILNPRFN